MSASKRLEILVSEDFVLPDSKLASDDLQYNEEVLREGIALVKSKRELKASRIVDSTIQDLIKGHQNEITRHKEEIDRLKLQLSETSSLSSQFFEAGRKAGREDVQMLLDEKDKLIKEKQEQYQNHVHDVAEGVQYIAKLFHKDGAVVGGAVQLGSYGENFVENQLKSLNLPYEVTYKETARGDFVIHLGNHNILVEVKNKMSITKVDLDKFYRDVEENEDVQAAMFLSMNDIPLIYNVSKAYIEVRTGKPILYLGAIRECPMAFHIGVLVLDKLLSSKAYSRTLSDSSCSSEEEYFHTIGFNCASKMIAQYHVEQANLAEDKKLLQGLKRQITVREKAVSDFSSFKEELDKIFPTASDRATTLFQESFRISSTRYKYQQGGLNKQTISRKDLVEWLRENGSVNTSVKELTSALQTSVRAVNNAGGIYALKAEAFGTPSFQKEQVLLVNSAEKENLDEDIPPVSEGSENNSNPNGGNEPKISPLWDPELDEMLAPKKDELDEFIESLQHQ